MGAVLYEMLTGQPPFLGASAGEILMKHVATEPDVTRHRGAVRTVISKAMAKDPAERYQSVQEMVEAVFGAEHVQQSVSCFRPDSLSMIAERVAQRVAVGGGSATPPPIPNRGGGTATAEKCFDGGDRIARVVNRFTERMGQVGNRYLGMGGPAKAAAAGSADARTAGDPAQDPGDPLCDPLSKKQRTLLAVIMLIIVSSTSAVFSAIEGREGGFVAFWTVALCGLGRGVRPRDRGAAHPAADERRRTVPPPPRVGRVVRRDDDGDGHPPDVGRRAPVGRGREDGHRCVDRAFPAPAARPLRQPSGAVAVHDVMLAALISFGTWMFTQGNFGLVLAISAVSGLLAQLLSPWDPFAARRRMGLSASSSASMAGTYPQVRNKDSAMPNATHPADLPTLAWASSPPPVPSDTLSLPCRRRPHRSPAASDAIPPSGAPSSPLERVRAWRVRSNEPFT